MIYVKENVKIVKKGRCLRTQQQKSHYLCTRFQDNGVA